MPVTIQSTETIRLTATFINYDPITGEEESLDPSVVDGTIYKWTSGSYVETSTFTPTEGADHSVYYDWTPGSTGKFKIVFETTIAATVIQDIRIFYVGTIDTEQSLGTEHTYYFLGLLDPLLISPDEVLVYYRAGDPAEIAELIHWYSLELLNILGVDELDELTVIQHDFIMASVLCDLARIYFYDGGIGGFEKADSFRLGDLQVSSASASRSTASINNLGQVGSWCELAALLRDQLQYQQVGIRTFVKASAWENPVRDRVDGRKFIKKRR